MTHVLILGGGSAGCVLASRLSEDRRFRVTLIEAGRDLRSDTMSPAITSRYPGQAYLETGNLWPELVAQVGRTVRRYEQARVLGGGSVINAMMSNRGAPSDYDEWGRAGAGSWSWAECLPFFRRLERDVDHGGELHGTSGPIPIRRLPDTDRSGFASAAFAAIAAEGFPRLDDQNAGWRDGVFASAVAFDDAGRRIPASIAYLDAAVRARPNLAILCGHIAERILFDGVRATGAVVAATDGGGTHTIEADEVIIAAGAIHSPALLMRSGIGPAGMLRTHGIDVVLDRPGVGANLMEHPMAAVSAYLPGRSRARNLGEHSDHGTLRFSSGEPEEGDGDMHLAIIARSGWHEIGRRLGSLLVWVNKPHSRGTVVLASSDPRQEPRVDFRLLSDERDLSRLKSGYRLASRLIRSAEMRGVASAAFPSGYSARAAAIGGPGLAKRVLRGTFAAMLDAAGPLRPALVRSAVSRGETLDHLLADDAALEAYLRASVSGVWHASGTCRMGAAADPLAVTDGEARVFGTERLGVCDGSIMPTLPRANTNVPIMMMAERVAHLRRVAA